MPFIRFAAVRELIRQEWSREAGKSKSAQDVFSRGTVQAKIECLIDGTDKAEYGIKYASLKNKHKLDYSGEGGKYLGLFFQLKGASAPLIYLHRAYTWPVFLVEFAFFCIQHTTSTNRNELIEAFLTLMKQKYHFDTAWTRRHLFETNDDDDGSPYAVPSYNIPSTAAARRSFVLQEILKALERQDYDRVQNYLDGDASWTIPLTTAAKSQMLVPVQRNRPGSTHPYIQVQSYNRGVPWFFPSSSQQPLAFPDRQPSPAGRHPSRLQGTAANSAAHSDVPRPNNGGG
eukprot:scaffold1605_cov158-Amphora_coffeaeformis.AAC.2